MVQIWTNGKLGGAGMLLVAIILTGCGGGATPEATPPPEPEPEPSAEAADEADREREARERERRREAEERRRREAERERVLSVLAERIHFDFDKSEIRPDAEEVLQRKVTVLREYPGIQLRIEGHCDERGSNEYNLALGQRRAEAARRYLVSYGLDPNRLATISYGEERPLRDASTEEAWALNRRDEFVVTDQGRLTTGD